MENAINEKQIIPIWEKRAVTLVCFGLVGFGALVGAISVYVLFIKYRIEEHFRIQATTSTIHDSKKTKMKRNSSISHFRKPSVTQSSTQKSAKIKESLSVSKGSQEDLTSGRKSSRKGVVASEKIVPSSLFATAGDQGDEELQVQQFMVKIDELLSGSVANQHEAYVKLDANKDKLKNSFEFWWRFSQAIHIQATAAGQQQDKDLHKTLLQKAVTYAERALRLNDKSSDAHKWFAIASGSLGEFFNVSEKIKNGFVFKQHIDRAVSLNPSDAVLHHLLGRFCFEVSQLSWIERRIASTLFSAPPQATIQEALDHFLDAEKIGKPQIENRLFIAKSYIRMSNSERAAHWLKLASQVEPQTENDKSSHKTAVELLAKYRKYL